MTQITKEQALYQLWEMGNLDYKLRGKQVEMKSKLNNTEKIVEVILCSRRFGKSYTLTLLAFETCLKKPNAVVKFACPRQNQIKKFLRPIVRQILKDCPSDIFRPKWLENGTLLIFPNGSEIHLAGTDGGNADNLRGASADLCIVDEAAFCSELNVLIYNIMGPLIDTTGGRIVMASTPNPKEPSHEFHLNYIVPLQEKGELIKYIVYDSPFADINRILKRYPGGENHPSFRCEYLCEISVANTTKVIPEFNYETHRNIVINDIKIPPFCHYYVSGDPAVKDLTAILFSYYDYKEQCLYVIDELILGGDGNVLTTKMIADGIKKKEKELFYDPLTKGQTEPQLRIMDNNNLILINDLRVLYGLKFIATKKDNKDQQADNLRLLFEQGRIKISSRCKVLIHHLNTTCWKYDPKADKILNEFERVAKTENHLPHHGDAVDALIYMVRNINFKRNPYPVGHGDLSGPDVFQIRKKEDNVSSEVKELRKMFTRKK